MDPSREICRGHQRALSPWSKREREQQIFVNGHKSCSHARSAYWMNEWMKHLYWVLQPTAGLQHKIQAKSKNNVHAIRPKKNGTNRVKWFRVTYFFAGDGAWFYQVFARFFLSLSDQFFKLTQHNTILKLFYPDSRINARAHFSLFVLS